MAPLSSALMLMGVAAVIDEELEDLFQPRHRSTNDE